MVTAAHCPVRQYATYVTRISGTLAVTKDLSRPQSPNDKCWSGTSFTASTTVDISHMARVFVKIDRLGVMVHLTGSCADSISASRNVLALLLWPVVLYTYVYVAIATKPVHLLQIGPIVHN